LSSSCVTEGIGTAYYRQIGLVFHTVGNQDTLDFISSRAASYYKQLYFRASYDGEGLVVMSSAQSDMLVVINTGSSQVFRLIIIESFPNFKSKLVQF
jgi:hypothetical protein